MNHLIQGIIPPVYRAHSARWPGCHRVHPTLGRETMLTTLHRPQFITLARKRTRCTEVLQWWGNSKNRRLHKKTSVQGSYGMIKHQRECMRFCVGTADTSNLHEKAKQQRARSASNASQKKSQASSFISWIHLKRCSTNLAENDNLLLFFLSIISDLAQCLRGRKQSTHQIVVGGVGIVFREGDIDS